jgi:hypothetical protein
MLEGLHTKQSASTGSCGPSLLACHLLHTVCCSVLSTITDGMAFGWCPQPRRHQMYARNRQDTQWLTATGCSGGGGIT